MTLRPLLGVSDPLVPDLILGPRKPLDFGELQQPVRRDTARFFGTMSKVPMNWAAPAIKPLNQAELVRGPWKQACRVRHGDPILAIEPEARSAQMHQRRRIDGHVPNTRSMSRLASARWSTFRWCAQLAAVRDGARRGVPTGALGA